MKKYLLLIIVCVVFAACKSKLNVVGESNATKSLSSAKIIKNHYQNNRDFKNVYIKANARYQDAKQTQNVTAEIRIKKDEAILVSIRFFGITMAKALITPLEVKYYEKINSEFFEGDYTTLSRWLGTDLDFFKVQNLLTGEALDNLNDGNYTASIAENLYKLESKLQNEQKTYFFEAANFLIKKQQIVQSSTQRSLEVQYPAHTKYDNILLPAALVIEAQDRNAKNSINITYTSVTFEDDFTMPYSVPQGYTQIFIN